METVKEGQLVNDEDQPEPHSGPKAGLKHGITNEFNDPLECLQCIGGLDSEFVSTLAFNSNDYCRKTVFPRLDKNRILHGVPWRDVSTQEMCQFLGMTLKISLFKQTKNNSNGCNKRMMLCVSMLPKTRSVEDQLSCIR